MAVSRPIRMCAAVLLLAWSAGARASETTHGDTPLQHASPQQFGADVQRLQGLVASCAAKVDACDETAVGPDERVGELDHGGYVVRWGWLRAALHKAKTAKAADSAQSMREANEHLGAMAQEAGQRADESRGTDADFTKARATADNVLRAAEFGGNDGPTWWDRKKAQMYGWLASLFEGVGRLGAMAPWLGRLLEWLLFLSAAAGLVVFVMRTLARQRMRVALGGGDGPLVSAWQREATDWARMAQAHADANEWREAVHCLYWAAIVLLEGRRAWRHNPTRTPREYVRLLKPGSAQQQGLRGLTQIFERVWYGQREADREAFGRAQACFRQLEGVAEKAVPTDAAGVTA